MVALLRLLYASATILITTLPVLANPTSAEQSTSQSPADIVHSLFVLPIAKRQQAVAPIDVDYLPDECKSPCKSASDKFTPCANDQCVCKDASMDALGNCLTCVVKAGDSAFSLDTAQSAMDLLTGTCNQEGLKVKSVKIGSSSNNSAMHAGLSLTGALAVVALGAMLAQA